MRVNLAIGTALVVSAMMLAGCAGDFNVRQTEPLRIQLEGSESRSVRLAEGDAPQQVIVENTEQADAAQVQVEITQVSHEACKVLVTVKNEASGETLATKVVVVGGANATTTETTTANGNATASTSATTPSQVVVENIFVNIKGKDNLVVITEAQTGEVDVNVAARAATANQTEASASPATTMA